MNFEKEAKSWLNPLLERDHLKDISMHISKNLEEVECYFSDLVFARALGVCEDETTREYNLVLKCSKNSKDERKNEESKNKFINEIYIYNELLPIFDQFHVKRQMREPFRNFATCYGTVLGENFQVIILEDMKKSGYKLWPKNQAMTRKHIDLVIEAYAKFHSTSAAMERLELETFKNVVQAMRNNSLRLHVNQESFHNGFKSCIKKVCDQLENDLDHETLLKWRNLEGEIERIFSKLHDIKGMKVVTHGDCWNNNFLYKYKDDDKTCPSEVVILDWQRATYSTPICDLSYFLFSCVSKEDLEELDDILKAYHQQFCINLGKLGIDDPNVTYPLDQFLREWSDYYKFGLVIASLLLCSFDGAEAAKSGRSTLYKARMRRIIEYVVKQGLI